MPATIHITDERMQAALTTTGGNLALAARLLGISRRTLARRVTDNPSLLEDAEETLCDEAMARVLKAIGEGDGGMARWYLSRYGHERGFGPHSPEVKAMTPEAFAKFMEELKRAT